ncbi:hypothetical protein [Fibrivirga algicola]|uniref:Lipoprotein n=1 Tax=Fibrivirga algicola TaxID=2950420 RepID=A0ABX0QKR2_9BACT|nr:hypothetical protein [Fibrivirga algicola]NID13045.1 hypothetical protein [Fibrivirga algicola]
MFFALLSCDKGEEQRVQILSVDSSFTVIKQTAPVLADSCVPSCWPRVFERETDSKPYRVFIVSLTIPGEIDWFSSHDFARRITDSLSYPLLMYLRTLAARELLPAGTSGDISKRLQYDVVDQLLSRRMDSVKDVGYLQVSQVIVDAKNRRGMYIIQQTGTGYVELLVQIRWVNGRWQFVREDRMSIS